MAFRLVLLHQTWNSFSCFDVSKSTIRRSAEGRRDSHKEPNLIITKGNEKLAQTRLNKERLSTRSWMGPCRRWPELLVAHVKTKDLRYGSGLKTAKIREAASAGAFDLSALLLTLAGSA